MNIKLYVYERKRYMKDLVIEMEMCKNYEFKLLRESKQKIKVEIK